MGDKMHDRRDYWDLDFTLDMMKPPEESIQSVEVTTYDIKPDYDLTPAQFWYTIIYMKTNTFIIIIMLINYQE